MKRGLYVVALDDDQIICKVWEKIIQFLSTKETHWAVDCLDCLYDTNLKSGMHTTEELLSELKGNTYIFSARMIAYPHSQIPDEQIISINDYFNSSCQSIVICADGKYFEIFSKCIDFLSMLSSHLKDSDVEIIEWTEDTLDGTWNGRTEFIV